MRISKDELRQALTEVREEELDAILKVSEDKGLDQEIEDSKKRLDIEKIHRMAQKQKKRRRRRLPRVAAAILVVTLVGTSTAYAIGKIHQVIVKWDTKLGENVDDFYFEAVNPAETETPKEGTEIPDKIERRYHPTYIAKGFDEYGEDWRDQSYRIVYKKKKERLRFEQMTKTEKTMSAPELSDRKNITVNGYDGQMGNLADERVLWFATNQYVFRFWTKAAVDWDELLHMAESVAVMPPDEIEVYYAPSYLPDGYSEHKDKGIKNEMTYTAYYIMNKEQSLVYSQGTLGGTISIDSEGAKRKKVDINGWKGQMNYRRGKKTIIWATNEYSFVLTDFGDISEEEMLKVARSVTAIEDKGVAQKN